MKVLNYGSLNIDYVYSVEHFVRSGETISSTNMEVFPGGKGLNQSIALARSGVEVWHAGMVGEKDGEFLLELMKQSGVHTDLVAKVPGQTGHAIIQRDVDGQNCILLYGGANQQVVQQQADQVLEHFSEGDILILQNEISEIGYIMEKAHERKMKIVLNPSPMDEKIFRYPLQYVDYFILNETEAEELCMGKQKDESGKILLETLASLYPKAAIVLTLGAKGAFYRKQDTVISQGIYQVPVVDTTAAGDTFTGYFVGGLVQGMQVKDIMDRAARAASIAVSRKGAAPSIPKNAEVM